MKFFEELSATSCLKGSALMGAAGAIGGAVSAAMTGESILRSGLAIGGGFSVYTFLQAALNYPSIIWGPRFFCSHSLFDFAKSEAAGAGFGYVAAFLLDPTIPPAVLITEFAKCTGLGIPLTLAFLTLFVLVAGKIERDMQNRGPLYNSRSRSMC